MQLDTTGIHLMLQISAIPACIENYIWLFHDDATDQAWVLDPGDTALVKTWLAENNKQLAGILITHHHWDHTDGVEGLLSEKTRVYGPGKSPLPFTTNPLFEGDRADIGWLNFEVLELPGHTQNHIAYLAKPEGEAPLLFCGDILFSAGCGRIKDGTAEQLHDSLQRIKTLPANTKIYCGHEYTLANLRFALSVEPENEDILTHMDRCRKMVSQGRMTLPTTLDREKLINPFLRSQFPTVTESCENHFGKTPQTSAECFAALRKWKDNFA